jgi:tetraacyldisaccharide 4'-kinase
MPRTLLLPLALLWRAGYLLLRFFKYKPSKQVQNFTTPLYGVGSLLAGGAGKTPTVACIAKKLHNKGVKFAILAKATGDEDEWLRAQGYEVFCGDRLRLCQELDGKYDVLLSDDGLEDKRLAHAEWILLDNSERAEGIRDLIPCGPCRSLRKDHPDIGQTWVVGRDIVFETEVQCRPDRRIVALCGIARPERFFAALQKKGIPLQKTIALPDHFKKVNSKVKELLAQGYDVVVTEKDAIKLEPELLAHNALSVAKVVANIFKFPLCHF